MSCASWQRVWVVAALGAIGAIGSLCGCERTAAIGSLADARVDQGAADADAGLEPEPAVVPASTVSLWAVSAGGEGARMVGQRVAVDPAGGLCVAGSLQGLARIGSTPLVTNRVSGAFVARLDADGALRWAVAPTGIGEATDVAAGPEGGCYVAGWLQGPLVLGQRYLGNGEQPEDTEVFVARLDAEGSCTWAFSARTGLDPAGQQALAVDAAGNAYLAGSLKVSADVQQRWPWSDQTHGCFAELSGAEAEPEVGAIFVTRLQAATGACTWISLAREQQPPAADTDSVSQVRGLALDDQGNLYLTGQLRADARFGATTLRLGQDSARDLDLDLDLDLFVARVDAAGNFDWAASASASDAAGTAPRAAAGHSIAVDQAGHGFVAGQTDGQALRLGDPPLSATVGPGAFVARFATRSGAFDWVAAVALTDGEATAGGVAADGRGGAFVSAAYHGRGSLEPGALLLPEQRGDARALVVARAAADGAFVWATVAEPAKSSAGSAEAENSATSLARDARGDLYVGGAFSGPLDFGVTELAPAGASDLFVWKLRGEEP